MKHYERCEMSIVLIITHLRSLLIVDCEILTCMDLPYFKQPKTLRMSLYEWKYKLIVQFKYCITI